MKFLACRTSGRPCWLALAVAALGAAASLVLFAESRQRVAEANAMRFAAADNDAMATLETRLREQGHAVRAMQGLVAGSDEVTRQEWLRAVERLELDRYLPALKGLAFLKVIRTADAPQFVADARRDDFTDFQIHPPLGAARDAHYVLRYHEPLARNAPALGFNASGSEPLASLMDEARDRGELRMTPLKALQPTSDEAAGRPGMVLIAPIYDGDHTPPTVEQRRRRLVGFAAAPMFIDSLVRGVLGESASGLRVDLYDVAPDGPRTLLWTGNADALADGDAAAMNLSREMTLRHGGREWVVLARAGRGFVTNAGSPWLFLAAGLVGTVLLAALVGSLASLRGRAEARARRMLAEAEQANARFCAAFDGAAAGMALLDADGRITYVNNAMVRLTGRSRVSLQGRRLAELSRDEDRPALDGAIRCLADGGASQLSHHGGLRLAEGHAGDGPALAWVDVMLSRVEVGTGESGDTQIVAQVQDVTQRRRREDALRHAARHDGLTDLLGRGAFHDALRDRFRAASSGEGFAVLFLDLDRFKEINDTLGHEAGDSVLRAAADRIRGALRERQADAGGGPDRAARLGGDEFALLLEGVRRPADAVRVAERVQRSVAAPYHVAGQETRASASIGVSTSFGDYANSDAMLRAADAAMYAAKRAGRGRFVTLADDEQTTARAAA